MEFTENQKKTIADMIKKNCDELENNFNKQLNQLTKENKDLKKNLAEMEKTVITLENDLRVLFKDLETTKRATFINDQYQRRNNLEISGIPDNIEDDKLESMCIRIANNIINEPGEPYNGDNEINHSDVEACHRLRTTNSNNIKNTIIRFKNRKHCDSIYQNKKKIADLEIEELEDSVKSIYVNDNICSYYKELAAKCRRLKKRRKISDTWTSYGTVKIKLKDGITVTITHQNDLDRIFPDFIYVFT